MKKRALIAICIGIALILLGSIFAGVFNSGAAGNSVGAMCEDPNVSSIRASIPGNVRTRSKAGWISGYGYRSSTDAGIVYASNGRYVIAVLSDLPAAVNQLDPVVLALHTVHSHLKK